MTDDIRLDTAELDRILRDTKYNAQQIITRMAFQIEGRAKMLAPVDTGALRSSIYVNTPGKSGFKGSIRGVASRAKRKGNAAVWNRQAKELPMPEHEPGAIVGSPMNYAAYVELGTSRMGARPFLRPAIETIAMLFNAGETWRELIK